MDFGERLKGLRQMAEEARVVEARSFELLGHIQADLTRSLITSDVNAVQLYDQSYTLAHNEWMAAALYATELRAEISDLIRARNQEKRMNATAIGQQQDRGASSVAPHSRAVGMLTKTRSTQPSVGSDSSVSAARSSGPVASLETVKCVPFSSDDISPQRKRLIRPAAPDVDQLYGASAGPMTDSQLRSSFAALLLPEANAKCGEASSSCVPFAAAVQHFEQRNAGLGVPLDIPATILGQLASLMPSKWRAHLESYRRQARGNATSSLPDVVITFDEFAYLAVRCARL